MTDEAPMPAVSMGTSPMNTFQATDAGARRITSSR